MRIVAAALLLTACPLLASPMPEQPAGRAQPTELAYGANPLQRVDLWRPVGDNAPLVIFVHGGGWSSGDKADEAGSAKPQFMLDRGFAFASVNYRLVPEATVQEQVQDVADAIGLFVKDAPRLGVNPRRIYLMGHSSGGHIAALLGTDPSYLRRAGVDISALAGIILLDGAALAPDEARLRSGRGPFGSPELARRLAPINHAAAPNARSFIMLNAQSADLRRQADILTLALRKAGTPSTAYVIAGADHTSLNEQVGERNAHATAIIASYLSGRL
jgi:acetyl esterase/lipase